MTACLAQLVEHPLHTRIVTSSSLVAGIFENPKDNLTLSSWFFFNFDFITL